MKKSPNGQIPAALAFTKLSVSFGSGIAAIIVIISLLVKWWNDLAKDI